MKKVAVIQNRFQRGGRLQVLVHIIELLNELGIVPDLITFKSRLKRHDMQSAYGREIRYHLKEIYFDIRLPFEWHILFFNLLASNRLKKYSLVINSNNTSFGLSHRLNLLSYVHFPRKARNIAPEKNLHFPEGPHKSVWDFRFDPFKMASCLYRLNNHISPNDLQVANSVYTQKMILKHFRIRPERVHVIYPPVDMQGFKPMEKKENTLTSLGRFAADKRQFEQILLAEKLQHIHFNLCGFVNEPLYYEKCRNYIREKGIKNVTLLPDASLNDITGLLGESMYFLHSLRNEPFGITTVQAIAAGCLPVVHDSGGQREVVPDKRLRYSDEQQALGIFKFLCALSAPQRNNMIRELQQHMHKYDTGMFRKRMKTLLLEKLSMN